MRTLWSKLFAIIPNFSVSLPLVSSDKNDSIGIGNDGSGQRVPLPSVHEGY